MTPGLPHHWQILLLPFLIAAAAAQVTPSPASPPPVPYASVSELNLLLSQLEQNSQAMQLDLAKLRIEKWKTDGNTKRGAQSDIDSINRNLQSALPEMITQLRNSQENLTATFKLYRNLNALYDVFSGVVESAGAFGSRDDYQSLQNDLDALDRSRRAFADRMETLSDGKEGELTRLRTQLRAAQAAVQAPPPVMKVVVDDTEPPPKKPVKKKSAAKTTKPSKPATSQQPATSSGSQSQTGSPQPPPK
jgi:hypothetical protein